MSDVDMDMRRILKLEGSRNIYEMLCITGYEAGDLQKAVRYYMRGKGAKGEIKAALADLINMANVVSIEFDYDFESLREFGLKRMQERLQQMNEGKE